MKRLKLLARRRMMYPIIRILEEPPPDNKLTRTAYGNLLIGMISFTIMYIFMVTCKIALTSTYDTAAIALISVGTACLFIGLLLTTNELLHYDDRKV